MNPRFFQEVLSNVARHARARRVDVSIRVDASEVEVVVEDDGVGLPSGSHPTGNGLRNMQTRAQSLGGKLHIEAGPGGRQVQLEDPDGNPIELHEAPKGNSGR